MLQNRRKNSKKLVSIIVENCLSAKTLYCGENKKRKFETKTSRCKILKCVQSKLQLHTATISLLPLILYL